MFRYTVTLTRPNTTVPFLNPDSDADTFEFLSNAAKNNVAVVQLFSADNLTSKIVFSAYSEEEWNDFANQFLFKDGKLNDSWFVQNNITYTITEDFK
jgi:hypothetical protein